MVMTLNMLWISKTILQKPLTSISYLKAPNFTPYQIPKTTIL
jgi:hypothetical protein